MFLRYHPRKKEGKEHRRWFVSSAMDQLLDQDFAVAARAWGFVKITVPKARQPLNRDTFQFQLLQDKLKEAQQRDGHYLLRGQRRGTPGIEAGRGRVRHRC